MNVGKTVRKTVRGERGQVLFLFVGIVTVFLLMGAVVVDLSLWLAERRDVQKVADLAAAAGAQELPVDDSAAIDAACDIAAENGVLNCRAPSDSEMEKPEAVVELLCNSGMTDVPGICVDPPGGTTSQCTVGDGCDSIRVTVRGQGPVLFSSVFGVEASDAAVASGATAGLRWGETSIDGVLLLDSTTSMGLDPDCDAEQDDPGCPMYEARTAAAGFVELLLGQGGEQRVGYAAYTHCYAEGSAGSTPAPTPVEAPCLDRSDNVEDPRDSSGAASLHEKIDQAFGLGDTNLCIPFNEASRMLESSSADTQAVVLLTDGDNNVRYDTETEDSVPPGCPLPSGGQFHRPCANAFVFEQGLDVQTATKAAQLKDGGVQVYVVGFGVCGTEDGNSQNTAGYCSGIGNVDPDRIADQRLLKCIASSPAHYFRVNSAQDLPDVFRQVAAAILGRRLLQ